MTDKPNTDPLLGPLTSNGGPTQTRAIPVTSPAFNAGAGAPNCPATDQRGTVRPQGAACDIGAFEQNDLTAPQTAIDSGPTGPTNDTTPTFTFSSEAGVTFECRVVGAAFAPCSSPFTTAALSDGSKTFEVRAVDAAGNTDPSPASRTVTIETTSPDTTISSGPAGLINDSTPTFGFASSESGSSFQCRIDIAAFAPCNPPYTATALADGSHTFEVQATDAAGNLDQTSAKRSFTVDTSPPDTVITAGPSGVTDTATPTFAFSSESGATFLCRLDGGRFFACSSPFRTPSLGDGPHTFEVRAVDLAGNADPSPASSFGANAALRAFTVQVALPRPVLAKTVNVEPLSGNVFVSVPPGTARASTSDRRGARASITVPGIKGRNFIPLRAARQVPVGSLLDTRRGNARLTSARDSKGAAQSGEFISGVFQVLQSRSSRGLTELRLKGSSFSRCPKSKRGKGAGASRLRRRSIRRRLRGNANGRFRTRGRYSAATVRGTIWTTTDRCDGTLTTVKRGKVAVRDFARKKTITLRTGKRYLAKARR